MNCSSPAKHPRTDNGLKDATTDLARLDGWARVWPDTNWGVRCDKLTVADVDAQWLVDPAINASQPGLYVLTGKGAHLYFTETPNVPPRCEGGRVVAATGRACRAVLRGAARVTPRLRHDLRSPWQPRPARPCPARTRSAAGWLVEEGRPCGNTNSFSAFLQPGPPVGSGERNNYMTTLCGHLAGILAPAGEPVRWVYDAAVEHFASQLDPADFDQAEWEDIARRIWGRDGRNAPDPDPDLRPSNGPPPATR